MTQRRTVSIPSWWKGVENKMQSYAATATRQLNDGTDHQATLDQIRLTKVRSDSRAAAGEHFFGNGQAD